MTVVKDKTAREHKRFIFFSELKKSNSNAVLTRKKTTSRLAFENNFHFQGQVQGSHFLQFPLLLKSPGRFFRN